MACAQCPASALVFFFFFSCLLSSTFGRSCFRERQFQLQLEGATQAPAEFSLVPFVHQSSDLSRIIGRKNDRAQQIACVPCGCAARRHIVSVFLKLHPSRLISKDRRSRSNCSPQQLCRHSPRDNATRLVSSDAE